MLGNALGDSSKKNTTFNQRTESFTEKYKKQLAKDLDEIENDEDENSNSTEAASEDPTGESINLDDLMNADDEEEEEEAAAKGSDEKQDK